MLVPEDYAALPPLPKKGLKPYFEERNTYDLEVSRRLNGYLSAEALDTTIEAVVVPQVDTLVPPLVAMEIASNPTITTAVDIAIDADLAGRDILETTLVGDGLDYSFAITDEDGRRTWLEANLEGKPTTRAAELIAESISDAIGMEIGLENTVVDLAFAVVDEDGRRTELEVGLDGKFTQRVIESLQARLVLPTPGTVADPTNPVIPAYLSMLVGQTYKLYFADFINGFDRSHTVTIDASSNGITWGDRWEFTPTIAKTFPLIINIYDRSAVLIKSTTTSVTVFPVTSGSNKRHLAIGDSITRAGNYSGFATAALANAKTVGTRTYDNGLLNVEGRGGWQLSQYFTQFGHAAWGDSPFLFPVGIAGNKFFGNTEFWRKVCYDDTQGYDFAGFAYIARGWKASPEPYLYSASGYPTNPTDGDVVVDPTKTAGSTIRQYSSGVWAAMNPQPAIEFSFSKYMLQNAAAFASGGPTSISIMLQTNDFYNGVGSKFAEWKTQVDTLITSIRAWSVTVPFVIILAGAGGPPQNWAGQGAKNKFLFDKLMQDSGNRILETYDTATNRTAKVFVTTFLGVISAVNMSDHVHPSTVVGGGHSEMAPYLAGMLAKFVNEGI